MVGTERANRSSHTSLVGSRPETAPQTTSTRPVSSRYAEGKKFRIDEPHLLDCFAVPRAVVGAMTEAALRKSSGSSFS